MANKSSKFKKDFKMGAVKFSTGEKLDYIYMELEGGGSATIPWADLWGMIFSLSNDRERDDIIPTRQREMMQFERAHLVKITKDMKAGETVRVICNVDVPFTVVESLKQGWTAEVREALGKWLTGKGSELKADDFLNESAKEVMHSIATNSAEKGVELRG